MAITVDQAVAMLRKLRDEIDAIEAEAQAKVNKLKVDASKVEAWLSQKSLAEGVDSFRSPHGTVYWESTDWCNVADWDTVFDWITNTGHTEMLTKGVSKTQVRDYMKESGELPPGLNYGSKRTLKLRKPTLKD